MMPFKYPADRAEYMRRYRADNLSAISTKKQAYYAANKEAIVGKVMEYARRNPVAQNSKKKAWALANPDKVRTAGSKWREANPERAAAGKASRQRRRVASKINATPPWLTKEDHNEILKFYAEAARLKHHVDHIVPLKGKNVSGLHVPWNLQVLPPHENIRKSNHHNNEVLK